MARDDRYRTDWERSQEHGMADRERYQERGRPGDRDRGTDDGFIARRGFGTERSGDDGGRGPGEDRWGHRGERSGWDRLGDEVSSWFGDDGASRRREGDARQGDAGAAHHRGRGPKGYQRSDERIHDDVNDRLTDDPHLDASDIEVSVSNREVTLAGTVGRREDKRRAEDIAEGVSGVMHVQNNLRVKAQGSSYEDAIAPIRGTAAAGGPVGGPSGTGLGGVEVTRTEAGTGRGRRGSGTTG